MPCSGQSGLRGQRKPSGTKDIRVPDVGRAQQIGGADDNGYKGRWRVLLWLLIVCLGSALRDEMTQVITFCL